MTFICGYIYNESVHIIADSAVTYINQDVSPISVQNSLGEITIANDGEFVFENAQKIYNLRNRLLVTFAGADKEGFAVIQQLNYELLRTEENCIEKVLCHFFMTLDNSVNHFIIGFYENDKPHLLYYLGPHKWDISCNNDAFVTGGERAPEIRQSFLEMLFNIDGYVTNSKILSILITVAISSSVVNRTFNNGIGGFFNGAYIKSSGVYWVDDTFQVLYSSKGINTWPIYFSARFNRDNATFVNDNEYKKYYTSELELDKKELIDKWGLKIDEEINNCNPEYFAFICYDTGKLILVSKKFNEERKLISLKKSGLNIYTFFSEEFFNLLLDRNKEILEKNLSPMYIYFEEKKS